ncbi:MAG: translation initiation factor IF-2 [Ruminococcaceae bacterium]|nr:translation initiation factor IF-2 [Oscillospiraceae bacterium]
MPRDKYRIHEVAKDFGMSSKEIIAILEKYSDEPKKHSTALEDKELNVIFDTLTQNSEVESFDAYFAAGERAKAEKAAPKAEPAAQQAKPAAQQEPAKEVKKEAPKADKKAPSKKDAPKAEKEAPKALEKKAAPQQKAAQPQQNAQPKKEKSDKLQARTKGEKRRVDTRSSNVDLEKYNEKYDEMASQGGRRDHEMGASKQKLKQKSQQYRKQGMRSGKRETEAEKLKRIAAERAKKTLTIKIPDEITVGELAEMLRRTAAEVIKEMFKLGTMATVNQVIDFDTAEIVATELGAKVEKEVVVSIEERIIDDHQDAEDDLLPRDPVVCVMGHVDHGKTSILDAIRNASVTATEAGGITQHIGAYRVDLDGQKITFLDTPGHAAFTSMRARGAMATDIAVLVVAADDGIMPQTIEAINHAKAAGVQIIVAINKMDKEGANPDRIKQQLTEHGLVPEEWGGEAICVPVSAKTHMGIDNLLESILLVAEMAELKANPNRAAKGVVIEARLDKGRGPIATLLVQNGTLNAGDIVVAGQSVGRVRVMSNERGQRIKQAGPSVPVEITGLDITPNAGDIFDVASDEKLARELVEKKKHEAKQAEWNAQQKVTLDNLFSSLKEGELKQLNIIVKADVNGSVEAVKQNLEKLSNEEVKVSVIHGGVGAINESDVQLAAISNAIIVGFNVRPDANAVSLAERDSVEMRMYRVIYDCLEEIEAAMKGMLAPKFRELALGRIEVRTVMNLSSAGKIAGSYVLEGKVQRNALIRVVRDGIVITEDSISSLRRFKDDVKEVQTGFECGIGLEKFNDIKEGDIFECFMMEEYRD